MVISCGQATRSALSFRYGARCWAVLFFVCGGASSREALSRPLPSAGQQNGVRSSGFPPGIRTFGAARCVHTVNDGVYRLCCRGTPSKHAPRTLNHFRSLPYQHRNLTRLSPLSPPFFPRNISSRSKQKQFCVGCLRYSFIPLTTRDGTHHPYSHSLRHRGPMSPVS